MKSQVDIITMGCSKNLVDSEILITQFQENGYFCVHDSPNPQGDIVVINTCGFIESAKQESINTILEFAEAKKEGRIKKLFVMGCLSQRYKDELEKEIPLVDKFYGKFNYKQLLADLGKGIAPNCNGKRSITTPAHYAYVKISEGCDRKCAYCAIPLMTGKHRSRSQDEIISEVKDLVKQGVKEFQIIAQELTYYGKDIDGKQHITPLIRAISDIEGVKWIRLHYAYPNDFPLDLLDLMQERDNICKYLDIALQHISDNVLSRMKRQITAEETMQLIRQIREKVTDIHLRTTLMLGFPGETEEDFKQLVDFVKTVKFESMGAFCYSEEEGTYAAKYFKDDIPQEVKEQRLDKLMLIQQKISADLQAEKVGKEMPVIIDRKEGDYYIARTQYSSPEVDPEVLIHTTKTLSIGEFYTVTITGSEEFDLYASLHE